MASSKWSSFVEQLKHNSPTESNGGVGEVKNDAMLQGENSGASAVDTPQGGDEEVYFSPSEMGDPLAIEPSMVALGSELDSLDPPGSKVRPPISFQSPKPVTIGILKPDSKSSEGRVSGDEKIISTGSSKEDVESAKASRNLQRDFVSSESEKRVPPVSVTRAASSDLTEGKVQAESPGGWSSLFGSAFSGRGRDEIAFAIGSDRVYLASRNRPEVVAYEAVVALTIDGGELVALGKEAETMRGREPQNIVIESVLKNGMVVDPSRFAEFLRALLKQHFKSRRYLRPRIVCAGNFPSPLARRGTTDAILEAGAREVLLCDAEIAAAKGLGVDMSLPELISVLLIENDWVGSVVASMGNSVTRLSTFAGQDAVLEDISLHLQETQGFSPRLKSLESEFVRHGFEGTLRLDGWEAWGDQLEKGRPKKLEVSGATCREAVRHYFLMLKHRIYQSLEPLDRDRRWNVQNAPIYFAGSCSNVPGFASLVSEVLNREVVSSPQGAWAMGHGLVELLSDKSFLSLIRSEA